MRDLFEKEVMLVSGGVCHCTGQIIGSWTCQNTQCCSSSGCYNHLRLPCCGGQDLDAGNVSDDFMCWVTLGQLVAPYSQNCSSCDPSQALRINQATRKCTSYYSGASSLVPGLLVGLMIAAI